MEEKEKEILNPDTLSCDVFISWTGNDGLLKDQIVNYLTAHEINCVESTSECSGDFDKWSRNAVHRCSVFLLLFTGNTLNKANTAASDPTVTDYVGLEIAEYKALYGDDSNRFLPLCTDQNLYKKDPWGLPAYASACWLGNETRVSEDVLEEILHKVKNLIIRHLHRVYRQAIHPNYIQLIPLYRTETSQNAEFDFASLYIPRTLTRVDDHQAVVQPHIQLTAEDIGNDILFISGSAGSGKSRYLEQLQQSLPESILPIVIPCSRLSQTKGCSLTDVMYDIFKQRCGYRCFYTRCHFESLLTCGIHVLLILDGMDEIPNAKETNIFMDNIKKELAKGGNLLNYTLLFTSRNPDDAHRIAFGGKTVCRYRLDPLTEENVRQLSQNLFVLFNTPQKNDDFYLQLADLDQEIRTNPLLLSQLAIVYNEEDHLPRTTVEIYDAVFEICLNKDEYAELQSSELVKDLLKKGLLPTVLKRFSRMRYEALSQGRKVRILELFCRALKEFCGYSTEATAAALVEYLHKRSILVEDDFYHKMFLEYFTAVSFYDSAFDFYTTVQSFAAIEELFSHYTDPYWANVIQLFLVKADSMLDSQVMEELYRFLIPLCKDDFTLLLDTCRDLLQHKSAMQFVLTEHILLSSVNGTYPAYGPFFWYVPEYDLYETVLLVLAQQTESADYSKMLALTRDVCFIFGQKNTVSDITDQVDPSALWQKAKLTGVRRALCEIFCTGRTDYDGGADIYPRCFNVAEAKAFLQSDCGITGCMHTPFDDELGLYAHEHVPMLNNAYIGFAALPYCLTEAEKVLTAHSCRKLRGIAFSPAEMTQAKYLSFNGRHVQVCYLPENVTISTNEWQKDMPLRQFIWEQEQGLQYIRYGLMGVTEIEEEQFTGFTGITDLLLPPTVCVIGDRAFANCKNLTSVTFTNPNVELGWDVFRGSGVVSVTFAPGMEAVDGFAQCHALTSVSIPASVRFIGTTAFEECTSLTNVVLSEGLEMIETYAFRGCSNLRSITVPESVTEVADGAFACCEKLAGIFLPKALTYIHKNTFAHCRSLSHISLPDTLLGIGAGAFLCCSALEEIRIPASVRVIAVGTFQGCSSLTRVTLPEGLEEIQMTAFYGCKSLTELSVPFSVQDIGNRAFADCFALQKLQLPRHLEPRRRFYVSSVEEEEESVKAPEVVDLPKAQCHTLTLCFQKGPAEATAGEVLVLSEPVICAEQVQEHMPNVDKLVVGEGFTAIGENAFSISNELVSVHLPQSLKVIEKFGFGMCNNLASVHLPDGLQIIEEAAFMRCESLAELTLPQTLTQIGSFAFGMCKNLVVSQLPAGIKKIAASSFAVTAISELTIPEGVTAIENAAFFGCENLTSVTIPNTVKAIGDGAFRLCRRLSIVQMPDSLQEMGESAFAGCHSLEQINIPAGIPVLRRECFDCCVSLQKIRIPESVTELEEKVFHNCEMLQSVEIPATVRVIDHSAFTECRKITAVTLGQRFEDDISYLFPDSTPTKITLN